MHSKFENKKNIIHLDESDDDIIFLGTKKNTETSTNNKDPRILNSEKLNLMVYFISFTVHSTNILNILTFVTFRNSVRNTTLDLRKCYLKICSINV